jgi:hypothetical protein
MEFRHPDVGQLKDAGEHKSPQHGPQRGAPTSKVIMSLGVCPGGDCKTLQDGCKVYRDIWESITLSVC